MKRLVTKKLKNIIENSHLVDFELVRSQLDNIEAQGLLNVLAPTNTYTPSTGWSLAPATLVHVLNDILINNRTNIVEFGAGTTTLYIARLLKHHGLNSTLISVDSEQEWIKHVKKQLSNEGLEEFVNLVLAPLNTSLFSEDKKSLWYNCEELNQAFKDVNSIDMVIVDGPQGHYTSMSRFGAVPYLLDKLSENAVIFLDDTHRDDEYIILQKWSEILNKDFQVYGKYGWICSDQQFDSVPIFHKYGILKRDRKKR
ncbi:MAG: class I SAM-dependent methyltransferase [Bacteroidota bacterium]